VDTSVCGYECVWIQSKRSKHLLLLAGIGIHEMGFLIAIFYLSLRVCGYKCVDMEA